MRLNPFNVAGACVERVYGNSPMRDTLVMITNVSVAMLFMRSEGLPLSTTHDTGSYKSRERIKLKISVDVRRPNKFHEC